MASCNILHATHGDVSALEALINSRQTYFTAVKEKCLIISQQLESDICDILIGVIEMIL
jgi:hypothetical protein